MEIVVWFLGKESEAKKLRETYTRGWPEVRLSKLFTADLFIPLHALLTPAKKSVTFDDILDESLFVDPELNDLDLMEKGEAFGVYVKRVNPAFVKLLAGIRLDDIPSVAKKWHACKEMTSFYDSQGWSKKQAVEEVERMLADVVKFAKRAIREKKAIMQIFSL
ncbi:MAG: hypothetical protein HY289_09845 [Planctomycetes bacterium]|nr:hypothetical protein [Planctomycetota bacterium]